VFANPDSVFTPGMFARVRLPGSPAYEALLVPDVAIGSEQARKYVLAVNNDNVATIKYVKLGLATADNLRIIKSGLAPGDRIIVSGLMRARPGQKVTVRRQGEQGRTGAPPAVGAPAKQN
jgi:multidrug efflux pump subunit AcrA (membrane-fusion protein)